MLTNLVYDRTAADVAAKNNKGLYHYTDMNRVQNAVSTIRARYVAAGYNPKQYTLPTWAENDIPRAENAQKYLSSIRAFDNIVTLTESVALPSSMNGLDYIGANNIEKFLFRTDEARDLLETAWLYCAEIYAGEVDM